MKNTVPISDRAYAGVYPQMWKTEQSKVNKQLAIPGVVKRDELSTM
jgi:hypothetical protein